MSVGPSTTDTSAAPWYRGAPAPEHVVRGSPEFHERPHLSSPDRQFSVGEWVGNEGAWLVFYAPNQQEFCHLLDGHVRLTDPWGETVEYRAGDTFIVPQGYVGIWENLTPIRKYFAMAAVKTPERL